MQKLAINVLSATIALCFQTAMCNAIASAPAEQPKAEKTSLTTAQMQKPVKVAVAAVDQAFMDTPETLKRTEKWIKEAAANGADLIIFTEAYLGGGYPQWAFVTPVMNYPGMQQNYLTFWKSAVERDGPELKQVAAMAKKNKIAVVIPFNERGTGKDFKAVFNSAAMIEKDGTIKHIERKTIGSHNEKMFWTSEPHPDFDVVELAGLRIAYNSCWQNYLPAIRHAQYQKGAQLFVASTADFGPAWERLVQTIADEGNVYVVSVGQQYKWEDMEKTAPELTKINKESFSKIFGATPPKLYSANGMFIDPTGEIVSRSKPFESTLIYGVVEPNKEVAKGTYRDVTTNYNIPIEVYYNGKKISP